MRPGLALDARSLFDLGRLEAALGANWMTFLVPTPPPRRSAQRRSIALLRGPACTERPLGRGGRWGGRAIDRSEHCGSLLCRVKGRLFALMPGRPYGHKNENGFQVFGTDVDVEAQQHKRKSPSSAVLGIPGVHPSVGLVPGLPAYLVMLDSIVQWEVKTMG